MACTVVVDFVSLSAVLDLEAGAGLDVDGSKLALLPPIFHGWARQ
jgi:hypothetical protein